MIVIIGMVNLRNAFFFMKEKVRLKNYKKKLNFWNSNREKYASKRANQSTKLQFG